MPTDAEPSSTPASRPACTVWLTGLSGAGKSTLAMQLSGRFRADGQTLLVLDGDEVRKGLSRDLGFAPQDRQENIRRVAEVAKLANAAGLTVVAALISPQADQRQLAREIIGAEAFIEVHLSTSLAVCAARDVKGLYARARAGSLTQFTGIDAAYEPPDQPDVRIDTANVSPEAAAERVLALLKGRNEKGR